MEVMQDFDLLQPQTLDEAMAFAADNEGARFLAGGTDLVVNLRRGIGEASALIDLTGVAELNMIDVGAGGARIGAGVNIADLALHESIAKAYPVICQAADEIAGPTHRRFATVGGNLCLDTRCIYYNQSHWWRKSNDYCLKYRGEICHVAPKSKKCFAAFSGDLAPSLLLFEATADLLGPNGKRTIHLKDMYREDGAAHLTLEPGELLVSVHVPKDGFQQSVYEKIRVRDSIDFPLAGVAVGLDRDGENLSRLKIAFTGTNSRPIMVDGLDEIVGMPLDDASLERVLRLAAKQISPMKSTSSPSTYRRAVASNLAIAAVKRLWQQAG